MTDTPPREFTGRDLVEALQEAAAGDENLMPYLLDSVKADATLGEICAALKEVFGTYKEPVVI